MATFVLVHGAFHGGWCWSELESQLRAVGHHAVALDLPGHGNDRTPIARVTLEENAHRVVDCLSGLRESVCLVAHSLGGMTITQAAEHAPERVASLVYVAALVPLDGQRMADLAPRPPADPVASYILRDETAGTFTLRRDRARETFYAECTFEAAAKAAARLEPESILVGDGRVRLEERRGARIPRVYVECLRDRAIAIDRQRSMQRAADIDRVLTLDTDHAPFLSRPAELGALLSLLV